MAWSKPKAGWLQSLCFLIAPTLTKHTVKQTSKQYEPLPLWTNMKDCWTQPCSYLGKRNVWKIWGSPFATQAIVKLSRVIKELLPQSMEQSTEQKSSLAIFLTHAWVDFHHQLVHEFYRAPGNSSLFNSSFVIQGINSESQMASIPAGKDVRQKRGKKSNFIFHK